MKPGDTVIFRRNGVDVCGSVTQTGRLGSRDSVVVQTDNKRLVFFGNALHRVRVISQDNRV